MSFLEILLIAIGLSMDAFAVAVCKGLSMKKLNYKKMLVVGLYFGAFQAIMPLLGYLLGSSFSKVSEIDHWATFLLLSLIGINMLKEAFSKDEEHHNDCVNFKTMSLLALATSIDAFAIGITFAFLKTNIFLSISLIGIITFLLSLLGVLIGNKVGLKYEKKAQIAGGVILILIGLKILLEHLEILKI